MGRKWGNEGEFPTGSIKAVTKTTREGLTPGESEVKNTPDKIGTDQTPQVGMASEKDARTALEEEVAQSKARAQMGSDGKWH